MDTKFVVLIMLILGFLSEHGCEASKEPIYNSTDEYPKPEAGYFDWLLGWTSYLDSNGKGYETNETQPQEEVYEQVPDPKKAYETESGSEPYKEEYDPKADAEEYNPVMETSPSKNDVAYVDLFDQILRAVAEFQASLTVPMQYLVKDASGASGVQVCILSRTRITFTTAVKSLMDSYEHWANIGTSLEDPYCRGHATAALEKFMNAAVHVDSDLSRINSESLGAEPTAAFKDVLLLLSNTFDRLRSERTYRKS